MPMGVLNLPLPLMMCGPCINAAGVTQYKQCCFMNDSLISGCSFGNSPMNGNLHTAWQSICSRAGVPNYEPQALLMQTPPIPSVRREC